MNHRLAILLVLAGLVLTGGVAHAATSETVELYMTKAVFAMNVEDDARAFAWFGKVLSVEPENVTALHLQGVTASRLGRFARAVTILKTCIALDGAPPEAHFDLGFALYSMGRYREAVVQFDIARLASVDVPSIDYYLGAALFRLREYERAVQSLEPVFDAMPEVRANAHLYSGASLYALGKYRRAQKHLEKAIELAPGSPVAQRADELLDATIRERHLAKWWDVRFKMGVAYDTNVLYEPDDYEVSDQAGFYGFTAFDGMVFPLKERAGSLGVGYSYFQSIHYDPDDEVLSDFDLNRHTGVFEGLGRIRKGYPGLYAGLDYELSYVTLGGQHYQVMHHLLPSLTLVEASNTATRASTVLQVKRFPDFQERDGLFIEPVLTQMFNFMQRRGKAAVEIGYQQNNAESNTYDYQGLRGFAGTRVPAVGGLSFLAGLQYRYLDYLNHAEKRIDRKITTDLGVEYAFLEFFTTQVGYRYARNSSLERYSWQKHVTTLSFQVEF